MVCGNHPTGKNVREIIDWRPVPSDKRYEEKIVLYKSGRITRMTRLADQPEPQEYPHYTEFYDERGSKDHWHDDPRWDAHHSASKNDREREGFHKTGQAILDDLDQALRDMKSSG